jgi:hypothetical protein
MGTHNFYNIIEKIQGCYEESDMYIENEEIETILEIAFPGYQVYYSDNAQDLLDEVQGNLMDLKLTYDDLQYDFLAANDVYFMIQKTHKQKGENE